MNLMTPGPTKVRENVRMARSRVTGNPDLESSFYDFYKETCQLCSELLHTQNETFLLSGEGILGLEAAIASMTEQGDRVLVLDNGVFGRGFADFVTLYGGEAVLYSVDYKTPIEAKKLKEYLDKDHAFKYATMVHCDTPSGMLNDIHTLSPLLKSYGIMTVVDSVSAMFGMPVDVDRAKIDILCGGSQKALSCTVGLTMVTVSEDAKKAIMERKTKIASFYCNLKNFFTYYEDQWFPYTMPVSDINGIRQAFDNIREEGNKVYQRHHNIAHATRMAVREAGLLLYTDGGYSDTVTVFCVPSKVSAGDILKVMQEDYDILLAGSFDVMAGTVIRIGHMGENANIPDIMAVMHGLDGTFAKLGVELKASMYKVFMGNIKQQQ